MQTHSIHDPPGEARPRLLLIQSGLPSYRRYILESLARNGVAVTLLTDQAPSWEVPYLEDVVMANLADREEVLARVGDHHRRAPVQGVTTYLETSVELCAAIAESLGLRYLSPDDAASARDKHRMRLRFRQAGLPTPRVVRYQGDLRAALAEVGLPAVLKPVAGYSSINVVKVERETDLGRLQAVLADPGVAQLGGGYLLESYVEGPEVSVESIVSRGEIFHAAITDKAKGPEPYFEEVGQTVSAEPPVAALEQPILEAATRGIRALGLNHCASHTELRISPDHGPVIMEIGARLAGDKIPLLVELATGVDLSHASALAALGRRPSLARSGGGAASIGYFVPRRRQTVQRGVAPPADLPGVVELEFWAKPGEEVAPPPERFFTRLGYAVTRGPDARASKRALARVLDWVSTESGVDLTPIDWAFA